MEKWRELDTGQLTHHELASGSFSVEPLTSGAVLQASFFIIGHLVLHEEQRDAMLTKTTMVNRQMAWVTAGDRQGCRYLSRQRR